MGRVLSTVNKALGSTSQHRINFVHSETHLESQYNQEGETGGRRVQGQPGLQRKFKASLGSQAPVSKKKNTVILELGTLGSVVRC